MILEAAALCLALNIYHEARGEPEFGQTMVGIVTLNRAEWKPNNVCNVVYEPLQFSWTLAPEQYGVHEAPAWDQAQRIAVMLLDIPPMLYDKGLMAADHYHADYIAPPEWAKDMERVGQIGRHIFYRSK